VPDELDCVAEHHLPGVGGDNLGFVDLRFDGEPDFTLFVENKLHSGYGRQQVQRYLDALDELPQQRRSGLVAVTRNYPSYGEDEAVGREGWLGSVRWAQLLPALRELKPVSSAVTEQWLTLLAVLEEQGDLGVTVVDTELVEDWSHYLRAREHLASILDGLREHALDVLVREVRRKHRVASKDAASEWRKGQRQAVAVVRDQRSVWVGFSVPAGAPEPCVIVQFDNSFDTPLFTVQAEPWRAHDRLLESDDKQFRHAAKALEQRSFKPDPRRHRWWANPHSAASWLYTADVHATLAAFIEEDFKAIAESGILRGELEAAGEKSAWSKLKRQRR
jgi:hypothetical protein